MPVLKNDLQRRNTCLNILLFSLLVFISAYSEEELELDDVASPKIESKVPQSKTSSGAKLEQKTPQVGIFSKENLGKNTYAAKATQFLLEKKYSQATTLLWANIDHLSESELVLLTKAHYLNKEYFESTKAANLVLAKNEGNFEALTYLGLCQLKKKKDREAKDYFRRASEANPNYMPAVNGLVEIYEKNSNYYELRLIYQDLIKRQGEKSEFLTRLCDINTKDGITDQAQTYCRKAIQMAPDVPENYSNLGIVYKNINETDKAKTQLKLAADKFPKSDTNQLNYAQFLEEQKNYIDAFKYFNRCVKINDVIEKCWVGYTQSSYQIQKFSETLVGLKKACAFNKKHSFIGRKASSFARSAKQAEWAKKIDHMSDVCGN